MSKPPAPYPPVFLSVQPSSSRNPDGWRSDLGPASERPSCVPPSAPASRLGPGPVWSASRSAASGHGTLLALLCHGGPCRVRGIGSSEGGVLILVVGTQPGELWSKRRGVGPAGVSAAPGSSAARRPLRWQLVPGGCGHSRPKWEHGRTSRTAPGGSGSLDYFLLEP